ELNSITGKNTYTLVDRPPNANVIGTRWVLSNKIDADGHLVKHKARLIAQANTREFGVDFQQTYSPVVNAASLRLLLAISANKGYAVDSLDISTAFLNGAMTDDVYVRQPPGYVDPQHPDKCFYLSQTSFIKDALTKFGLDYLPACTTPMDHTVDPAPIPGFKAELSDANMYRSMVGTLAAWVANWTRPELAFTVHKLQRTQHDPEPKHFEAAERAFRYLKGTQSESLRLGGDLVLRAFSDSDFCSDRIDGKSVTGYVLFLGDAPIVWSSKLQGAVTTSTVEAEYIALQVSVKDIMWLRHLLADLGCPQQEPTPAAVEDNSACIEWANDMVINRKNRHFHVSYHLAKEQVGLGTIRMNGMFFIKTHDQLADIFTKALNAKNFGRHQRVL
ncbi:unnamed protein product, partial [Heterosigma akashiwo]